MGKNHCYIIGRYIDEPKRRPAYVKISDARQLGATQYKDKESCQAAIDAGLIFSDPAPKIAYDTQCTRCRNKHFEKDRVFIPNKKQPYLNDSCCPKCRAAVYYSLDPETGLPKTSFK